MSYRKLCQTLLRFHPLLTLSDIVCNFIIFGRQAAITYCVQQILNGLTLCPQGMLTAYAAPYLAAIIITILIRVGAIRLCSLLDAKRAYYYQNRVRLNLMTCLSRKKDVLSVSGQADRLFEALDDDVPKCTFPPELLTEVSGYVLYTMIALGMLLSINAALTLFIFLPLSAAIFGVRLLSDRMKERRRVNRTAHDAASAFILDAAENVLAVKTAGAEEAVLKRYDQVNAARREAVLRDAVLNERVSALLNGAVYVGAAIMMFIAARLIAAGSFAIGDFSIYIAHLGTLSDCTVRVTELFTEYKKAEVSYERLLSDVDEKDRDALLTDCALSLNAGNVPAACVSGRRRGPSAVGEASDSTHRSFQPLQSFEVQNLTYRYENGSGFENVSFCVRPGQLLAVAGEMASGKSTLMNVLMGLLPAQSGSILLNGAPDGTGVIGAPARGGFFGATLRVNLCLNSALPQPELEAALRTCAADELCLRLDDEAGERGERLSGGQRQRLMAARALCRAPSVLLMDDCVSALDAAARKALLRNLKRYLSDNACAAILATNEPDVIAAADVVVRLKQNGGTPGGR